MDNDNLKLYNELRAVPKEAQKQFSNGKFSGTDINPMWRIKKLTETFGAAGLGWYTEVVYRHIQEAPDGTICTFIGINLYVKYNGEWSKPIYGEGGNTFATKTKGGYLSVTDEAFKMAYTDALGIAAKALGLGADIWFANDKEHGTKYDQQRERKEAEASTKEKPVQYVQAPDDKPMLERIAQCSSADGINALLGEIKIAGNDTEKAAFLARAKELNLTYNKTTDKYAV